MKIRAIRLPSAFISPLRLCPAARTPRWSDYGGSRGLHAVLRAQADQQEQRGRLELAWSYWPPARPAASPSARWSSDGVMYVVGKDSAIVALDAATGKQIWTHPVEGQPTNRGFNYWQSKDTTIAG